MAEKPMDVFVVENWKDAEGADHANWIRVGVAFAHKDSKGFNVDLRALPVTGKLVIRQQVPREEESRSREGERTVA